MKKVIITGATGFLGIVLVKEFIKNGVFVYAICRENSRRISRLDGLENIKIIETKLNCQAELTEICKMSKIDGADVFYHLAWGGERNSFGEQYKNVDISVNCLRLAEKLGCKRFVCAGSQAEYGNTTDLITEETLLRPSTAYGSCKAAAYYLTADLAKRLNIEHTWVRIFSVFGEHDNPNTLVSQLMDSIKTNGVFSLATDGKHIWNYLHEADAARALYLIGECKETNTVFNLAHPISRQLMDYVEGFRETISPESVVTYGTERSITNLNVSTDRLRRALDWSPDSL